MKKFLFLISITIVLFSSGAICQNFPPYEFTIYDSVASEGYYFTNPYKNSIPYTYDQGHIILDRYGRIIFYRVFDYPSYLTASVDFKIQPDGRMSYFNLPKGKFMVLDSNFTEVDSIWCANGYDTDQHDMQIISGNHFLLFGTEIRVMNLSSYHFFGFNHNQPGATNADVLGVVIQEFDENKNLVWEWKSHDHFQFGDVDERWLFSATRVDWTHANAVELDQDSNVLLSMRHFNEITKINHVTGDIIWRLGGKQNQFTFPNDPVRFSGQHDIRRVSDSSVTFFDNGQLSTPDIARAVEYQLDETNKVATLIWSYIQDPALNSKACGNHQKTGNGNHLVDYGFTGTEFPWMVVVKEDKSEVVKLSMPTGISSYRAFNYTTLPWELRRPAVDCDRINGEYFLVAEDGHSEYKWSTGATTQSIRISDTGTYNVFVPYGVGYLSSEFIKITDVLNPCIPTGTGNEKDRSELSLGCFPNPAFESTRIIFELPYASEIDLSVITLTGIQVKNIHGKYSAGRYEIPLEVSGFQKGMYLVVLTTDRGTITGKLFVQ